MGFITEVWPVGLARDHGQEGEELHILHPHQERHDVPLTGHVQSVKILNAVGKEDYGFVPDGEEPCRVCEEEIKMRRRRNY